MRTDRDNDDKFYKLFQTNGYIASIDVLSPFEAIALRLAYDQWVNTLGRSHPIGDERFKPHLLLPFINDVVRNEVIQCRPSLEQKMYCFGARTSM